MLRTTENPIWKIYNVWNLLKNFSLWLLRLHPRALRKTWQLKRLVKRASRKNMNTRHLVPSKYLKDEKCLKPNFINPDLRFSSARFKMMACSQCQWRVIENIHSTLSKGVKILYLSAVEVVHMGHWTQSLHVSNP